MTERIVIERIAFEVGPDRGYTCRIWRLKQPSNAVMVEIFKDVRPLRCYLYPAYRMWNVADHFSDIVDSEVAGRSGLPESVFDRRRGQIVPLPAWAAEPPLTLTRAVEDLKHQVLLALEPTLRPLARQLNRFSKWFGF